VNTAQVPVPFMPVLLGISQKSYEFWKLRKKETLGLDTGQVGQVFDQQFLDSSKNLQSKNIKIRH
jgi:hypothetical protein